MDPLIRAWHVRRAELIRPNFGDKSSVGGIESDGDSIVEGTSTADMLLGLRKIVCPGPKFAPTVIGRRSIYVPSEGIIPGCTVEMVIDAGRNARWRTVGS